MTKPEDPASIERIVGCERNSFLHVARAVSEWQRVYILHSKKCLESFDDLRDCAYSEALDNGIDWTDWEEDIAVTVCITQRGLLGRAITRFQPD